MTTETIVTLCLLSPDMKLHLERLAHNWLNTIGSHHHHLNPIPVQGINALKLTITLQPKATWNPSLQTELTTSLQHAIASLPLDHAFLWPNETIAPIKLLLADMDSTLVDCECIDEIASLLNLKPQMATLTEATMRGELEFEDSLRQRVALLKGLPVEHLTPLLQTLPLMPGAQTLIQEAKAAGLYTAVVSGGFTLFTQHLQTLLGLNTTQANRLIVNPQGLLTGEVEEPIIGKAAKATYLHQLCNHLNITPKNVLALGDGANDLDMLQLAGLGIAYHAKPLVARQARFHLQHCNLLGVLAIAKGLGALP